LVTLSHIETAMFICYPDAFVYSLWLESGVTKEVRMRFVLGASELESSKPRRDSNPRRDSEELFHRGQCHLTISVAVVTIETRRNTLNAVQRKTRRHDKSKRRSSWGGLGLESRVSGERIQSVTMWCAWSDGVKIWLISYAQERQNIRWTLMTRS